MINFLRRLRERIPLPPTWEVSDLKEIRSSIWSAMDVLDKNIRDGRNVSKSKAARERLRKTSCKLSAAIKAVNEE